MTIEEEIKLKQEAIKLLESRMELLVIALNEINEEKDITKFDIFMKFLPFSLLAAVGITTLSCFMCTIPVTFIIAAKVFGASIITFVGFLLFAVATIDIFNAQLATFCKKED